MFTYSLIGTLILFVIGVILLMNDKADIGTGCIVFSIIGLIISLCLSVSAYYYNTEETTKELKLEHIQQRSEDGTIYYLYDFEGKTRLCNDDALYILKFDSGDIESELREGKTYKVTYRGKRSHLWSWYPNIIKVDEVK